MLFFSPKKTRSHILIMIKRKKGNPAKRIRKEGTKNPNNLTQNKTKENKQNKANLGESRASI